MAKQIFVLGLMLIASAASALAGEELVAFVECDGPYAGQCLVETKDGASTK